MIVYVDIAMAATLWGKKGMVITICNIIYTNSTWDRMTILLITINFMRWKWIDAKISFSDTSSKVLIALSQNFNCCMCHQLPRQMGVSTMQDTWSRHGIVKVHCVLQDVRERGTRIYSINTMPTFWNQWLARCTQRGGSIVYLNTRSGSSAVTLSFEFLFHWSLSSSLASYPWQ